MTEAVAKGPAERSGARAWKVRRARTEEVPAIAEAVAELLVELGGTPPPPAAIEAEVSAHIVDPSLGIVLVAGPEPDELLGVLAASWARAVQIPGRLLTIEVLWTHRDRRGQGVGAALVEALATEAAADGDPRIEVGLPREGFPALGATARFYLANGFERLGPRMRRSR